MQFFPVRALALIFLFMLTACAARTNMATVGTHPANALSQDRAVLVEVMCDGERRGWGTGVMLTAQSILTAEHVVDSPECSYVVTGNVGHRMPVRILEADVDRDMAILYIPQWTKHIRPTETRKPVLGEWIQCTGYGWMAMANGRNNNEKPALSTVPGWVVTTDLMDGFYRFTAPSTQGLSGGGCWGADGKLVLIVQRGRFPSDGDYYGRTP